MRVMKVKTCGQCPFTPADLGKLYDPRAHINCCIKCPETVVRMQTHEYPRDNYEKRKEVQRALHFGQR